MDPISLFGVVSRNTPPPPLPPFISHGSNTDLSLGITGVPDTATPGEPTPKPSLSAKGFRAKPVRASSPDAVRSGGGAAEMSPTSSLKTIALLFWSGG